MPLPSPCAKIFLLTINYQRERVGVRVNSAPNFALTPTLSANLLILAKIIARERGVGASARAAGAIVPQNYDALNSEVNIA